MRLALSSIALFLIVALIGGGSSASIPGAWPADVEESSPSQIPPLPPRPGQSLPQSAPPLPPRRNAVKYLPPQGQSQPFSDNSFPARGPRPLPLSPAPPATDSNTPEANPVFKGPRKFPSMASLLPSQSREGHYGWAGEVANDLKQLFTRVITKKYDKAFEGLSLSQQSERVFKDFPLRNYVIVEVGGIQHTFLKGDSDNRRYHYTASDFVGGGAYGKVYKAVDIINGKTVAIKAIHYQSLKGIEFEMKLHKHMGTYVGEPITPRLGDLHFLIPKIKFIPMHFIDGRSMLKEYEDVNSQFDKIQLYIQAKQCLKKLHFKTEGRETGYRHGDTQVKNFVVERRTGKVWMVDFDHSYYRQDLESRIEDMKELLASARDNVQGSRKDELMQKLAEDQTALNHGFRINYS